MSDAAAPRPLPWALALRLLAAPAQAWPLALGGGPAAAWRFTAALALGATLAATVGFAFMGLHTGHFGLRFLPLAALGRAAVGAVLLVALALLLAEAARLWAPRFGAQAGRSTLQAATLQALGPVWLWGHALVWPLLWWAWPLALAAGLWQLHLGLRAAARPRQAVAYTTATALSVAALALLLLLGRCSAPGDALAPPPFPWSPQPGAAQADGGPPPGGAASAAVDAGAGGGRGAGAGLPPDLAGSGAMGLPPGTAASATADLERWTRSAPGGEPRTRSVLEDLLPGPLAGFDRQVTESYAHAPGPKAEAMLQVLGTSASARVENHARGHRGRYLHLSIDDLAGHGPALAAKLLNEIVETGGQATSDGGRSQRSLTTGEQTVTVLACQRAPEQCTLDILVAERYLLRAESAQVPVDELRRYVAQVDIAALVRRAQSRQPVE